MKLEATPFDRLAWGREIALFGHDQHLLFRKVEVPQLSHLGDQGDLETSPQGGARGPREGQ